MIRKVILIAVVALFSSQVVRAGDGDAVEQRSLLSDISNDLVKPIATNVLNKGMSLFLPSNYNFDAELDKYIGFIVNIGNTINAMFKTGIDMLKSAKTRNRAPGALFNPRVYDAGVAMAKHSLALGKHCLGLLVEVLRSIKYGISYISKFSLLHLPSKIAAMIFGVPN